LYWPGPQQLYELQPVYGFANSSKDGVRFLRAAGHSDLYFLEDREAPFDQVLPCCKYDILQPMIEYLAVFGATQSVCKPAAALLRKALLRSCWGWGDAGLASAPMVLQIHRHA